MGITQARASLRGGSRNCPKIPQGKERGLVRVVRRGSIVTRKMMRRSENGPSRPLVGSARMPLVRWRLWSAGATPSGEPGLAKLATLFL